MPQTTDITLGGAGYMVLPGTYKRSPLGGALDRPGGRLAINAFSGGQLQPLHRDPARSWSGLTVLATPDGGGVEPWARLTPFADGFADAPNKDKPTNPVIVGGNLYLGMGRRLYKSVATSATIWSAFTIAADLGVGITITDISRYKDDLLILVGSAQNIRKYNTATGARSNPWIAGERGTLGIGFRGQILFATGLANDNYKMRLSIDKFDGTIQFRSRYFDSPIRAFGMFAGAVIIATETSLYRFNATWDPGATGITAEWTGEPEPLFSLGSAASGDDFVFLLELRGRLYTWIGGGLTEFDPGLGGGWRRVGPTGTRCYGATVAAGYLVVALETLSGPALWAYDGRGWWQIEQRPAGDTPRIWPAPTGGAGNRDLVVLRHGNVTYDLYRLTTRDTVANAYPETGVWVSSLLDADDGSRPKVWRQVGATFSWPEARGNPASVDPVTIALDYSTDAGLTWTEAATASPALAADTTHELRAALSPAPSSRHLQLRVRWSSVADWAPVLTEVWADYSLVDNAPRRRRWALKVHARDGQIKRDGGTQVQTGRQLAAALWAAWQTGNALAYRDLDYDADPTERMVRIAEITEEVPKPADAGRWGESVLALVLIEA